MVFKTTNNFIIRIPDNSVVVMIGEDTNCIGEVNVDTMYDVSRETAIKALEYLKDKEIE